MLITSVVTKVLLLLFIVGKINAVGIGRYRGRMLQPNMLSLQQQTRCRYNICEEDDEYPEEDIWQKLLKFKDFSSYFGEMHAIKTDKTMLDVESRVAGNTEDVCESRQRLFYPKSMFNIKGTKKFLINVASTNYTMQLVSEICNERAKCKGAFTTDRLKCVQKYGTIKLLSYSKGDEELLYDLFLYPTTCVCKRLL